MELINLHVYHIVTQEQKAHNDTIGVKNMSPSFLTWQLNTIAEGFEELCASFGNYEIQV